MNDTSPTPDEKQNIWLRGLFMLLMLLALHLCVTVLGVVTVIQFLIALLGGAPNERLMAFGRNLGSYLRQISLFLTFGAEEIPFPFSEWPAD